MKKIVENKAINFGNVLHDWKIVKSKQTRPERAVKERERECREVKGDDKEREGGEERERVRE